LGIERCGKINASNSGSESWTGIGVVAGFGAVVLIRQWPHGKKGDVRWRIRLLQIPQELTLIDKTRNQFTWMQNRWWDMVVYTLSKAEWHTQTGTVR
jgi:hypothetical protein